MSFFFPRNFPLSPTARRLVLSLALLALCSNSKAQELVRYPLDSQRPVDSQSPIVTDQAAGSFHGTRSSALPGEQDELSQVNRETSSTQLIEIDSFEGEFARAYSVLTIHDQIDSTQGPAAMSSSRPAVIRLAAANSSDAEPNATFSIPSMDEASNAVEPNSFVPQDKQVDESHGLSAASMGLSESATWWKRLVEHPLDEGNQVESVDTNSLVFLALRNSPRIQAISQNPLIRESQVVEADADFDPVSFVRSQFEDRNDPVGNTLTTGGADFLEDHIWYGEFGLRKKTRTGATVNVSERLGFQNSNSTFFVPQDQGTATLALNVTQPLLRGRGQYINQSQVLIAQLAQGAAWSGFEAELQDELQSVAKGYWRLYYDRSLFLQKKKSVERGQKILEMLQGRIHLDSLPSQIARARSAVNSRRTDLANAFRDVRNSETEIRRSIADKNWLANQSIELIPIERPTREAMGLSLEQVVYTALEHRNEISETLQRSKIAGVQRDVSVNDLLPELSFLMGTYVSALKGESQLGQAIQDQLGENKPGYSVGIEFELPIWNRAARSRLAQRSLQVAKIKAEVEEIMQTVIAESQVALRRVNSALETISAAEQAIDAARADLTQNYRRWESFALVEGDLADGQTPTTILDQLLDSQERLSSSELIFSQAELELKNAEIALQRTMGTLLIHEKVDYSKFNERGVPTLHIDQLDDATLNTIRDHQAIQDPIADPNRYD